MMITNLLLKTADEKTPAGVTHVLSLFVILKDYQVPLSLPAGFWWRVSCAVAAFTLLGVIVFLCTWSTANALLRPLRELNERMLEIMNTKGPTHLRNGGHQSSEDIADLYLTFQDLIQDWQFSQNDFLNRRDGEDVLSIVELATTCEGYRRVGNLKAVGVCYNNIANLHLRNGKYEIAAANYQAAIE